MQVTLVTNTSDVQITNFSLHLTNNVKFYQSISISEIKSHFHLYLISIRH